MEVTDGQQGLCVGGPTVCEYRTTASQDKPATQAPGPTSYARPQGTQPQLTAPQPHPRIPSKAALDRGLPGSLTDLRPSAHSRLATCQPAHDTCVALTTYEVPLQQVPLRLAQDPLASAGASRRSTAGTAGMVFDTSACLARQCARRLAQR
jgi:hypothetical protein